MEVCLVCERFSQIIKCDCIVTNHNSLKNVNRKNFSWNINFETNFWTFFKTANKSSIVVPHLRWLRKKLVTIPLILSRKKSIAFQMLKYFCHFLQQFKLKICTYCKKLLPHPFIKAYAKFLTYLSRSTVHYLYCRFFSKDDVSSKKSMKILSIVWEN